MTRFLIAASLLAGLSACANPGDQIIVSQAARDRCAYEAAPYGNYPGIELGAALDAAIAERRMDMACLKAARSAEVAAYAADPPPDAYTPTATVTPGDDSGSWDHDAPVKHH